MMKICNTCGVNERLPWHTAYCRDCYRVVDRRRYYANREKRLAKDAERYAKMTKEEVRARFEKAKKRSPEKFKARQAVRNAITQGKIVRLPCEECGTEPTHAHHTDYSKPLLVTWLCKQHHYERHRKYKLGE